MNLIYNKCEDFINIFLENKVDKHLIIDYLDGYEVLYDELEDFIDSNLKKEFSWLSGFTLIRLVERLKESL